MGRVTTLLVTSHLATREAVTDALRSCERVALLCAVDEQRALCAVARLRPDVALIEATGEVERAQQLVADIARVAPVTASVLLCVAWNEERVAGVLTRGAKGCVDASRQLGEIEHAIHAVANGELWASRMALAQAYRLAVLAPANPEGQMPATTLSFREREIVECMQAGLTNKEIGRRLGISDVTVKTHAQNIFHKLNISSRRRLLLARCERSAPPLSPIAASEAGADTAQAVAAIGQSSRDATQAERKNARRTSINPEAIAFSGA